MMQPADSPHAPVLLEISAMGHRARPAMERLASRVPGLRSAVLCSADGLNLCAVGVEAERIGKMAALASSLFTVGRAVLQEVAHAENASADANSVLVSEEPLLVLAIKIPHRITGYLVLLVAADRGTIGTLLVGARATAKDIETSFS